MGLLRHAAPQAIEIKRILARHEKLNRKDSSLRPAPAPKSGRYQQTPAIAVRNQRRH
ncbi:hypothetical protein [Pseudaminobacter sp. NGMCC 1.201702]|uniref:hypothetical protein n=1 Tax=Pseudaminobacter sp. NGMCC 1.201702 TaxID=3391825 RepID=UPI0039EF7BB6